jgi:hypothetical protein
MSRTAVRFYDFFKFFLPCLVCGCHRPARDWTGLDRTLWRTDARPLPCHDHAHARARARAPVARIYMRGDGVWAC